MRALIAGDDHGSAAILTRALQQWGLEVIPASTGIAAWDVLNTGERLPLAIIQRTMAGIDGLELCRRVRQQPELAGMYIILLTGEDGRADLVRGLEAGADDYIVEPFDAEELRARVQVGLRVARLQQRLGVRVSELQSVRDELERLASTDALTNVNSRRQWFEQATIEFGRYRRYNRSFSLVVADLDYLRRINDTYGHHVGDEVLKRFSDVLRLQCRQSDVAGRLGGEEFAVLLPETSGPAAGGVARRIVESCRAIVIGTSTGEVTCTCSVGFTEVQEADENIECVLRRSDEALQEAKREGRNRWAAHPKVEFPVRG